MIIITRKVAEVDLLNQKIKKLNQRNEIEGLLTCAFL